MGRGFCLHSIALVIFINLEQNRKRHHCIEYMGSLLKPFNEILFLKLNKIFYITTAIAYFCNTLCHNLSSQRNTKKTHWINFGPSSVDPLHAVIQFAMSKSVQKMGIYLLNWGLTFLPVYTTKAQTKHTIINNNELYGSYYKFYPDSRCVYWNGKLSFHCLQQPVIKSKKERKELRMNVTKVRTSSHTIFFKIVDF